jgi:hypothetical protein
MLTTKEGSLSTNKSANDESAPPARKIHPIMIYPFSQPAVRVFRHRSRLLEDSAREPEVVRVPTDHRNPPFQGSQIWYGS